MLINCNWPKRTNAATVSEKLWIPSFHNLVVGTECIQY